MQKGGRRDKDVFALALWALWSLVSCSESVGPPCKPAPVRPAYSDAICLAGALPVGSDEESTRYRRFVLERAAAAGVRTFRDDFTWSDMEPEQGKYSFAANDARMDDLSAAGGRQIGLITYGNPWAAAKGSECVRQKGGNCTVYPPDDPFDYARFAGVLADRYRASVRDWEIWNEQNSGIRFWAGSDYPWKFGAGAGGDPSRYGELLGAAYATIKRVQPESRVAYGGLFFHEQFIMGAIRFLELSLAARPELTGSFDVLAYHPYTLYPPQVAPEYGDASEIPLLDMHRGLASVLEERGAAGKEFWVTEVGWPVYGRVDEEKQAQYLVRSTLLALSAGATRVCWFTFQDGPEFTSFPPEQAFGLFRYADDRTTAAPKPSYEALETMSSQLEGTRYTCDLSRELELGTGGHAYLFEGNGNRVLAAWSSSDGPIDLAMDRVRALFGRTAEGVISLDRGRVSQSFQDLSSLTLTESPLFLVTK